ncbi:MAG: 3'-5' exonuclease domain-containing protein 2 [Prevotellaceae bacterium]|jgi:ribonuclease D|nr:3'-5' exonuclease domain-containing protein 2 [Prevotellaceae bacterium]
MTTIKETIDKEAIREMPKALFTGEIQVVSTAAEVNRAVAHLESFDVVGIDSETRPSFVKGQLHKVALLQVASDERCYLFRLNLTGLTPALVSLLESTKVTKVGLSLHDDFLMLHKRAAFTQQACIDLQDHVRDFGIQEKSLQKIYAILFGRKISKSQRLSNWEADTLTPSQQLYAATDAWACLHIYRHLCKLNPDLCPPST